MLCGICGYHHQWRTLISVGTNRGDSGVSMLHQAPGIHCSNTAVALLGICQDGPREQLGCCWWQLHEWLHSDLINPNYPSIYMFRACSVGAYTLSLPVQATYSIGLLTIAATWDWYIVSGYGRLMSASDECMQ